jgi:DNA-binding NtrC family response regulator
MLKVLCVSFDDAVSRARVETLTQAGCEVTATLHPEEAIRLLSFEKFDVAVIGHRFPKTERHHLAETARRKKVAVVLVCGASADGDIPATRRVYALEGMRGLEEVVRGLQPQTSAA